MNKITEKIPDFAPDGAVGTKNKSLLSPVTDTVGHVLNTGLKPVGYMVGQVGDPTGEAVMNVQNHAKKEAGLGDKEDPNKPDSERPGGDRIGGNAQTGGNPLGL